MPVTYEISDAIGGVHTRCSGDVSFSEVVAHFQRLEGDASLPRKLNVLLDLTELSSLPDGGQLIAVAAEVRRVERRIAFGACAIAAREDAAFGVARMFERLAERSFERTRSFRDLGAAQTWLASLR